MDPDFGSKLIGTVKPVVISVGIVLVLVIGGLVVALIAK